MTSRPMNSLCSGLSAFPLTPLHHDQLDIAAYAALVRRLAVSGVDSITALGSTGSYAYLSREERHAAARIAVENASGVPVFLGIGALRTSHVQALADDAQEAGAAAVLLAPLTYQAHTEDDVFGLYESVTRNLSVPLIVYDNPGTTHFTFTEELYARVAELPNVASIKIPGVPADADAALALVLGDRGHSARTGARPHACRARWRRCRGAGRVGAAGAVVGVVPPIRGTPGGRCHRRAGGSRGAFVPAAAHRRARRRGPR